MRLPREKRLLVLAMLALLVAALLMLSGDLDSKARREAAELVEGGSRSLDAGERKPEEWRP